MIVPEQFGKYKIKEFLGSGAFGFVYLAEDTLLKKDVALKIQKYKGEKGLELLEEARILFELNHDNIVRFFNIEIIEDKIVLVMEPVLGNTLRDIVDQKSPLSVNDALEYVKQILKALEYAHSKGLVHGDIKPENILISEETGKIKIADFGLAKIFKAGVVIPKPVGTPFYMAPEAWRGETSTYSDIYSVGCILCELLTKKPPFYSENLEELRNMVFNGKFDKIPGVPPDLNEIIKKTLNKVPSKRPTASELLSWINRILKTPELAFLTTKTIQKDPFFGNLTEEQIKFVEDTSRKLLLKGVVGSGKTTVLAYKSAYWVKKLGFDPSSLLFLTFTGKAVNIFKGIIEKILGEEVSSKISCMTFHQLGEFILRYAGERIGVPEDFRVITDAEGESIISEFTGNTVKARSILREIKKAKSLLISIDEFSIQNNSSTWNREVREAYERYTKTLEDKGLLDYEDLIYKALLLLRTYSDVKKDLEERFKVVIVDEFQDVNKAIFELILEIVGEHTYLWASGDEAQSIYTFRGASPVYLKKLIYYYPNLKEYSLTTNFRTSYKILEAGYNLLSHTKGMRVPSSLPTQSSEEGIIVFSYHEDEIKEAKYVAEKVKELKEEGYDYTDIAVIYRINEYSRALEDAFKKAEIPYTILESGSFYDLPEIEASLGILEYLSGRYNIKRIEILLRSLFGLPGRVVNNILKDFSSSGKLSFSGVKDIDLNALKSFWSFVNEISKTMNTEAQDGTTILEQIVDKLKESTNLSYKNEENIREFIYTLREMNLHTFGEILSYVSLMREVGASTKRHHGVLLLTAHKAKGLEFPIVFITGLIEGLFPLGRHRLKQDHLDEERRLLFVALTRAQKRVYLTYPLYYRNDKTEPSRFILEMAKKGQ
ncbi:MAG: UvrD-helicase domain-containing protein [candidate division WOR-3 bacterium]